MLSKNRNNQSGFTIIELMIATTIFSFILLIATAGIIRIGQLYYKGVTESKVQNNVRSVSDDISRSIQFAKGTKYDGPLNTLPTNTNPVANFCLGDYRYTGYIDKPFKLQPSNNTPTGNQTGLWAEKLVSGSACGCPAGTCVTQTEQLLGVNTRLLYLYVENLGVGIEKGWHVNVRLAYGDNDLLTHYNDLGNLDTSGTPEERVNRRDKATCRAGTSGGSFCATAQLDTVVKKRLN